MADMKILPWEWILTCANLQTVLGSCLGQWGWGCAAEAAARVSPQEQTLAPEASPQQRSQANVPALGTRGNEAEMG